MRTRPNQTALIAHEAFYAYLRSRSAEKNSIRTRRAIGSVMAGNDFLKKEPLMLPKEYLFCYGEGIPYSPTQLILYWEKRSAEDKGRAIGYPIMSNGSQFLGLNKQAVEIYGLGHKTFLSLVNRNCEREGLFMSTGLFLESPIEFGRELHFTTNCKGGEMLFYFSDHKLGEKGPETTSLTCKLHQQSLNSGQTPSETP